MVAVALPPAVPERVVCSVTAAAHYQIPPALLLAVAEQENGKAGQWVQNSNGTADVGPMQFNTAYLAGLHKYGITPDDVAQTGCYPYELAAWRISGHLRHDSGDLYTRAADYHSYTPHYNAVYRLALIQKVARWEAWLTARFTPVQSASHAESAPLVGVSPENTLAAAALPHINRAAAQALAAEFTPHTFHF